MGRSLVADYHPKADTTALLLEFIGQLRDGIGYLGRHEALRFFHVGQQLARQGIERTENAGRQHGHFRLGMAEKTAQCLQHAARTMLLIDCCATNAS
jgi:hypothetical protein